VKPSFHAVPRETHVHPTHGAGVSSQIPTQRNLSMPNNKKLFFAATEISFIKGMELVMSSRYF